MAKKAATIENLKVRVNKDGTLSKKSLEDVLRTVKPNPVIDTLSRISGRNVVHVGSFVGLTVAVKYGIVDPLSFFLGKDWSPGKNIQTVVEDVKDGLRQTFMRETDKQKKRIIQKLILLKPGAGTSKEIDAEIARLELRLDKVLSPESEQRQADFEVWFGEHRELIEWLSSMGIAGFALKFAESHTVSDIVELAPGQ